MANGALLMKTMAMRQDELIEDLLRTLRPQLDGREAISSSQYRQMQTAIANFAQELMEKPR
jgi:hypothetical protein